MPSAREIFTDDKEYEQVKRWIKLLNGTVVEVREGDKIIYNKNSE